MRRYRMCMRCGNGTRQQLCKQCRREDRAASRPTHDDGFTALDSKTVREVAEQIGCAADPKMSLYTMHGTSVRVLAIMAAEKLAAKWGVRFSRA